MAEGSGFEQSLEYSLENFQKNIQVAIDSAVADINSGNIQIDGLENNSVYRISNPSINLCIGNDIEHLDFFGNPHQISYLASAVKPAYLSAFYGIFKDNGLNLDTPISVIDVEDINERSIINKIKSYLVSNTGDPAYEYFANLYREHNPEQEEIETEEDIDTSSLYNFFRGYQITFKEVIDLTCNYSSNESLIWVKNYLANYLEKNNLLDESKNPMISANNLIESTIKNLFDLDQFYIRDSIAAKKDNAHNTASFLDFARLQFGVFNRLQIEVRKRTSDPVYRAMYTALKTIPSDYIANKNNRTHEIKFLRPFGSNSSILGKSGLNISLYLKGLQSELNGWKNAPESMVYTKDNAQVVMNFCESFDAEYFTNSSKRMLGLVSIDIPIGFKTMTDDVIEDVEVKIQQEINRRIINIVERTIAAAA